jgi:hypothetical protein
VARSPPHRDATTKPLNHDLYAKVGEKTRNKSDAQPSSHAYTVPGKEQALGREPTQIPADQQPAHEYALIENGESLSEYSRLHTQMPCHAPADQKTAHEHTVLEEIEPII